MRIHQLIKKPRVKKKNFSRCTALQNSPQKKGVCKRVYQMSPKKPNSAKRKVANVLLSKGFKLMGYIPGEGHNLQEHSIVLIRGGRAKDLPGVKYHLVSGVLDFKNIKKRERKRSKYGMKKSSKK